MQKSQGKTQIKMGASGYLQSCSHNKEEREHGLLHGEAVPILGEYQGGHPEFLLGERELKYFIQDRGKIQKLK